MVWMRGVLWAKAPDATVFMVTAFVVKIYFTVLDDVVAPVVDIECAVGSLVYVDGAIHSSGSMSIGSL